MIINRLQTMKKNAYTYCEGSFASYQATKDNWGNPDWSRFLTRIFYNSMFGAGTNPTGYISEKALQNKLNKKKTCQDHYLSPQFMGRMILDNQEKYLSDYETYKQILNDEQHIFIYIKTELQLCPDFELIHLANTHFYCFIVSSSFCEPSARQCK